MALANPKGAAYYLQMIDGEPGFSCEHLSCQAFAGREEYCEVMGRDPEEDIAIAADCIDAVLEANLSIAGSNLEYSTSEAGNHMQREFTLFATDGDYDAWQPVEIEVFLSRDVTKGPGCVRYDVAASWKVHQPAGNSALPYTTRYCLEIWNASAQATITEHDMSAMGFVDFPVTDKLVERPMTPYDHEQLIDLLASIGAMQDGQALEAAALSQ